MSDTEGPRARGRARPRQRKPVTEVGMGCDRCGSNNPESALFCFRCGQALRAGVRGRADRYAVQTAESVSQFALISTVLPHTNRKVANGYRWALLAGGTLVLLAAAAGLVSLAVVGAALLVPIVYLIYLYDVNLWEDSPISVVAGVFIFTGLLSAVISLAFFHWVFDAQFTALRTVVGGRGAGFSLPPGPFLLFSVVLPVLALIAMNIGPLWLASRPRFDDMIDGLTFGVAAGTAYAAVETLVAFSDILGGDRVTEGLAVWVPTVVNLMILKPLLYGCAAGIAVAVFSGRGEGFDGFTSRFLANFSVSAATLIAYWVGVRLLSYLPLDQLWVAIWGTILLALLVVRVRVLLHAALLEAALEQATAGQRPKEATTEGGDCPECGMALLPDALFCVACGSSVRATSTTARRLLRASGGGR